MSDKQNKTGIELVDSCKRLKKFIDYDNKTVIYKTSKGFDSVALCCAPLYEHKDNTINNTDDIFINKNKLEVIY